MKKKCFIIIAIIILILLIILGIIYIPVIKENYERNTFKNYIQNIAYDVKIQKAYLYSMTGGYDVRYTLINLEDSKSYSIYYNGSMGEDYSHYGVNEKDLTQEQLEQILTLSDMESEQIEHEELNDNSKFNFNIGKYYWEIEYKGREITLNELPFSEEIL